MSTVQDKIQFFHIDISELIAELVQSAPVTPLATILTIVIVLLLLLTSVCGCVYHYLNRTHIVLVVCELYYSPFVSFVRMPHASRISAVAAAFALVQP